MDYKAISELLKSMSESKLSFLEIESEGVHITMKKEYTSALGVKTINPEMMEKTCEVEIPVTTIHSENVSTSPKTEVITGENNIKPAVSKPAENVYAIKSPIVGTFYRASGPNSENFVNVGSKVKKGDTLCIIEAMKLMNEIESEVDGEIIEIPCENEQLVEYDQPLFVIKITE